MASVNLQQLLQQHKEEELVVLPDGEYTFEVLRATVRGDNGILPILKVVGGPYAGKLAMIGQLTLTEAAKSIFFRNLKGFGLDTAFVETCQSLQDIANALVGRIVKVQVQTRAWKGEDRNTFPIGGVELVSIGGGPAGVPVAAAPPAAPAAESSDTPTPGSILPPPPPAGGAERPF